MCAPGLVALTYHVEPTLAKEYLRGIGILQRQSEDKGENRHKKTWTRR